jgi:hypothetical protein
MFKITIEGASLTDLAANILTMASQFQTTAVQESKPTTGKPRKAASSAATVDSASSAASVDAASTEENAAAAADETSASAAEASPPATASEDHPIELGAIKERALLYSQKAGPTVIGEMLQNAGAPTGKFSEIGENMDALKKVSDALAAAGY